MYKVQYHYFQIIFNFDELYPESSINLCLNWTNCIQEIVKRRNKPWDPYVKEALNLLEHTQDGNNIAN